MLDQNVIEFLRAAGLIGVPIPNVLTAGGSKVRGVDVSLLGLLENSNHRPSFCLEVMILENFRA